MSKINLGCYKCVEAREVISTDVAASCLSCEVELCPLHMIEHLQDWGSGECGNEEEEKEIETEKWMRVEDIESGYVYFRNKNGITRYTPSKVMDRKDFLRWGGTMPDGSAWTNTNSFRLWAGKDIWSYNYSPEDGCINQVFAEYAEMRVEK